MEVEFKGLKKMFTWAPILMHFDLRQPSNRETDISDLALLAILFLKDDDRILHPIALHSRKFQLAEINYEFHNKELLAIVDSFEVWMC
jgi:hypothetical protein